MFKPLLTLAALIGLASPALADGELEKKLEKKLAKPWLKSSNWLTDYDAAKAEAKKTGKVIFGYFTRSYAYCPPCEALEQGALSKPEFKEFAKDVVLFCHITTRIPGRKDDGLLSEKGGRGFPYLVYMDAEGNVLGKPSGRSVKSFKEGVQGAQRYLTLAKKADKTPAEQVELFELEVEFGKLTLEKARAKRKELALPAEHDAKLGTAIKQLEVAAAVTKATRGIRSRAELQTKGVAAGKTLYDDYLAKGIAPGGMRLKLQFYALIMEYGVNKKVVAAAEAALKGLKQAFGSNPRAKAFLAQQEQRVEQLKASQGK